MAKEFKNFDRMFSKAEIMKKRQQYLQGDHSDINRWIGADKIEKWDNAFIREVVYFAEGSLEWQLFRVSIKGLSTQEKLLMLQRRYSLIVLDSDVDEGHSRREKCRIDNYIGALRRGGQLNENYEVVK